MHSERPDVAATLAPPQTVWLRGVAHGERLLALVTEVPAALLVVVEILVLLSGVISRYVFHRPLGWTDELASMLFLWLAMLGAVIALRRSSHMRMTALVDIASPGTRAFLDLFAVVASGAFLLLILHPAYDFASE
ncbi:MAG: TRAP transporter small permease subunit, partial [Oxalobacteraceae bacterium]